MSEVTLANLEMYHRKIGDTEVADLLVATQEERTDLLLEISGLRARLTAVEAELVQARKLLEWVFSALEDMDFAHCDASLVVAHTDISEWLRQHPAAEEAGR